MQFKVPQNVQIEDKILPFMTLRQLIISGVGGGFTYIIYIALEGQPSAIWMPPVGIFGILTLAVAFLRIRDIPFIDFILLILERYLNETKRVWVKSAGDVFPKLVVTHKKKKTSKKNTEEKIEKKKASISDVTKLSKMLDEGVKS
jgi:hypothetical protein